MRNRYKYGIFVASAILACAPLAMSNDVLGTNHVVQAADKNSDNNSNGDKSAKSDTKPEKGNTTNPNGDGSVNPNTDPTKSNSAVNNGETAETAYQIKTSYDENIATKIKAVKGLTQHDVYQYVSDHSHIFINGKEAENRSDTPEYKNPDGTVKDEEETKQLDDKYGYNADVADHHDIVSTVSGVHDKDDRPAIVNANDPQIEDGTASMLLHDGDVVRVALHPDNLLPNKWYSWKLEDNFVAEGDLIDKAKKKLNGKLPDEIAARIKYDPSTKIVIEKTDNDGLFPRIESAKDENGMHHVIYLGDTNFSKGIYITISNDKDAVEIPHDAAVIGKERTWVGETVVPDDNHGNKQEEKPDIKDASETDPNFNIQDWNNDPVDNGSDFTFTSVTPDDVQNALKSSDNGKASTEEKQENSKAKVEHAVDPDRLVFIHNAYVYNGKGELVHDGNSKIVRIVAEYQKAKILDNGLVHFINNKKFYRIGDNQFIKVANVGQASQAKNINTRGTIKASRKYGVRLYDKKGHALKKVLRSAKRVHFDQKKFIKGHIYYHIKGTKTWVRSGNVKLVKHNKK